MNPHSRSKDLERVTPMYDLTDEGQYKHMQTRKAGNKWRGRSWLGRYVTFLGFRIEIAVTETTSFELLLMVVIIAPFGHWGC